MMHKAWSNMEEVLYCFSKSSVNLQGHKAKKNRRFWPKLGVSGLLLQFEFTNDDEMMHKAWSNMEDVPYCFSRSSVKLQGHTAKKNRRFWPKISFQTVTHYHSMLMLMWQENNDNVHGNLQ